MLLSRLLRKEIGANTLPGRPDFIFPRKKIAVFLHGCFWHRCPQCALDLPKRNRDFWANKFERNKRRDRRVKRELESTGWRVIEIWEHELKEDPLGARKEIQKLKKAVHSAQPNRQENA
jgi:DNA mismatch endonuclease (patch repair protein)